MKKKEHRTITRGTLRDLLKARGMAATTYHSRLKRGWTERRALNEPIHPMSGRPTNRKHRTAAGLLKLDKAISKADEAHPDDEFALRIGRLVLATPHLKDRVMDMLLANVKF